MINKDYLPTEIIIKFQDDEKLKAIVALKFGKMVIRGFRVWISKYNDYWITPPAYYNNITKKFHPMFYLEDLETWNKIREMILEEMDKKLAEPITEKDIKDSFGKDIDNS